MQTHIQITSSKQEKHGTKTYSFYSNNGNDVIKNKWVSLGVTPPTNSGIMDFNCNFPAKIAQQPRDQNHKQFERPNLLNPNWNLQRFCWIKSLLGKGKGSSAGTSLLRDKFCSATNFAKGQVLLRDSFC